MTLGDAIRLFLSQQKATTKSSYKYVLSNMEHYIGGARLIADVTIVHIGEYAEYLDTKNYAIATWNKFVKTTKTFFNWCIKNGIISASPARILKLRSKRGLIDKDKAFPDDDLMILINYAQVTNEKRLLALVLFCADTGCRRGGASRLRVRDLDFAKRMATITEKGDASRPVKYSEWASNAIQDWLRTRKNISEYVFTETERQLSPAGVSQYLRRYCIRAGIRGRGVHSLRHRKGFQFSDHRISPSVAQTALGHTDVLTTLNHYYPKDWDRASEAFDELAMKPPAPPNPKMIQFPKKSS